MVLAETQQIWDKTARQLMCANCVTINGSSTVAEAAHKMKDMRCSSAIVESGIPPAAYGIITRRDIVDRAYTSGAGLESFWNRKVREITSEPLIFVRPHDTIRQVVEKLKVNKLRRVAVMEGKKVLGIISDSDIFNQIIP